MGVRGIMNDVLRHHVGLDDQEVRPPVYIAGAFGSDPDGNTDRAVAVGRVAQSRGFAPFVPHTSILAGVYGKDEILEERNNGMVSTLSLVIAFAQQPFAFLWLIESHEGFLSQGTQMEFDVWGEVRRGLNLPLNVERHQYEDWIK